MSYNIHGLLYLVEDYKKYGTLDNCSIFPFENYIKVFKSMIRKPGKQLEQVLIKYNEPKLLKCTKNTDKLLLLGSHNKGPLIENTTNPQFRTLIWENYKLKSHVIDDSYFCTFQNEHVKLINIVHSKNTCDFILIGRQFEKQMDLYSTPINSSDLGMYVVNRLSNTLKYWNIFDIKKKLWILFCNDKLIAGLYSIQFSFINYYYIN